MTVGQVLLTAGPQGYVRKAKTPPPPTPSTGHPTTAINSEQTHFSNPAPSSNKLQVSELPIKAFAKAIMKLFKQLVSALWERGRYDVI